MYFLSWISNEIVIDINTMLCPIKVNSNTIELRVHPTCYLRLRLTLCYRVVEFYDSLIFQEWNNPDCQCGQWWARVSPGRGNTSGAGLFQHQDLHRGHDQVDSTWWACGISQGNFIWGETWVKTLLLIQWGPKNGHLIPETYCSTIPVHELSKCHMPFEYQPSFLNTGLALM